MPLIIWNENLSVKIGLIDRQHQKLIDLINRLYDATKDGRGKDQLDAVINELELYAKTHFTQEEKYFKRYDYPAAESHIRAHGFFIQRVQEFKKSIEQGSYGLQTEILNFLKFWTLEHIMRVDKKYGPFLTEKGLR